MQLLNNISKIILGALVGFAIAFFLAKHFLHIGSPIVSTPEKTIIVRLVSRIDTVYKKQFIHDTVRIATPTIVKIDTIYKPGTKELAYIPNIKRIYQDSIRTLKDSITLHYTADVSGTLNNIQLGFKDYRAQKTIIKTDSVFTTTTIKQYPAGLFIGVDAGYNTITPKLEYTKNLNSFSAGYNIITKTPQVGYSRRIW